MVLVAELAWALDKVVALDSSGGRARRRRRGRSVRELGQVLFTDYAFAFEATSVLILVAMVGAVVLARREGDA